MGREGCHPPDVSTRRARRKAFEQARLVVLAAILGAAIIAAVVDWALA